MIKLWAIILVLMIWSLPSYGDAHLIIYATYNGATGHCGIAIDEYRVTVKEKILAGRVTVYYDSIKTGALNYYDVWPLLDVYKGQFDGDVSPGYFKLPSSSFKQLISLRTLADQGIPHKLGYPCDAILSLETTKRIDFELGRFLDGKIDEWKSFNSMNYNCCDFAMEAITFLTGEEIKAKEFVVKDFVTTPNEMYKCVSNLQGIIIRKNPGVKVNGSFFQERILSRILPILSLF